MILFRSRRLFGLLVALALSASALSQNSPFMRLQKPTATQEVLQTKARKYVPKNGKGPAVWLVGVAHVGNAGYYKEIQKLLDVQTTVLYEGVTRKGVDPAAPKPEGADDPRLKSTYQTLSNALGLQFQLFGIDYKRPGFHNSDLAWEEMQAIEAKHPGPKGGMSLGSIGNMLNGDSDQGKALATALSSMKDDPSSIEAMHLIMIETLSDPGAIEAAMPGELSDLLIKSRNAKVLSDLKSEIGKTPAPISVAVFFGAGHMADMEKHLTADMGYVGGEERWFTAIDGDSKKVSGNGQMMLQMMRSAMAARKKPAGKGGGG